MAIPHFLYLDVLFLYFSIFQKNIFDIRVFFQIKHHGRIISYLINIFLMIRRQT